MTKEEIINEIECMIGAQMDNPFEGDFDALVFRHTGSKKWFGILMEAPKKYFNDRYDEHDTGKILTITLKCDPLLRELLANTYSGIYPAWHMNKKLWASVPLDGRFPDEEIIKLLHHSFDLTNKKSGASTK